MVFSKVNVSKIALIFLVGMFFFCPAVVSQTYSSQQMVQSGHWVYDAINVLSNSVKRTSFAVNSPISVGELKMYLELIPYDKLNSSGKALYQKVFDFLSEKGKSIDMGPVKFAFNLDLYPQVLFKTNSNIDWSFATDYTGRKNSALDYGATDSAEIRDFYKNEYNYFFDIKNPVKHENYEYMTSGTFSSGTGAGKAAITVPLYLCWSDYVVFQTDPCIARSIWGMTGNYNFTNIPFSSNDFDFLWPRTAYGSAGKTFEKWGINLNVARSGLQIGKTQTGSIVYNSTFETECYFQLNLYSPRLKYNLDVAQIERDKYMYIHYIAARPFFNWLTLGIIEGTLIQKPFELRFLNPLMIMHSFGAWNDYSNPTEEKLYGESHVAAYMGWQIEATPIKNTRLYFLYAQNEIQSDAEKSSASGNAMPDSLGGQLGFELTVPDDKHGGWWIGTIEGIYTSPYLYIKQGADWSLYSKRYNMQSDTESPICSWIGTPFGPDAIGAQARIGYSMPRKWNAEMDLLFVAHGTNSFGLFDNTIEINGEEYYAYYPSVLYRMGLLSAGQAANIARDYKLTGTIQYTNQVTLKGSYSFNSHLELNGQAVYTFIFNNRNREGNFEHGFELSVALDYLLF